MATDAVSKVTDAFFEVFCGDLVGIVFVAAITGVGLQIGRVANLACAPSAMIQWEAVYLVELGWRPGLCIVAGSAIGGE